MRTFPANFPRWTITLGLTAMIAGGPAQANEEWPSKPIRLLVPAPAGGGTADPVARLLAEGLEKTWGYRIVVDNKPGGSGVIAGTAAAQASPDGYTFLLAPAAMMTTTMHFVKSVPWHPQRSFDSVALFGTVPIVLAVNKDLPTSDLASFVANAKSNPSTVNFGSTGNGTASHLSGELFMQATHTRITHVPYVSPGQATTDTISGNIQATFQLLPGVLGQINSGMLRPIAVFSKSRSPSLPNVPTTAEEGYPSLLSESWFSVVAPKGTPKPIITKLNAHINQLLERPDFVQQMNRVGVEPLRGGTPAEFESFLESEIDRWAGIVERSGAKPKP